MWERWMNSPQRTGWLVTRDDCRSIQPTTTITHGIGLSTVLLGSRIRNQTRQPIIVFTL